MKFLKNYKLIIIILIVFVFLPYYVNAADIFQKKEKNLEEGIYVIKSALDEKYVFNIEGASSQNGGNLELRSNANSYTQRFSVKSTGNDTYTISVLYDDKYLDVDGSKKQNGTNVAQWEYHGGNNQQWTIKAGENGYYNII